MGAAVALGEGADKLGVVLAGGCVAALLTIRDPRRRALVIAIALVLTSVLLLRHIWNTEQFRSISDDAVKLTALLTGGIVAVGALAVLLRWRFELFAPLAFATLPFRVPIAAAGSTANLLVPLYLVIAAAAIAYVSAQLHPRRPRPAGATHEADTGATDRRPGADPPVGWLAGGLRDLIQVALGAFVALYGLQALYSNDLDTALEQMVFFYVPFALMLKLLTEVRWSRELLLVCVGVLLALALCFSAIGFWEYERRELLWNPKVIAANQFEPYFRVNSVFWDPNVYGRFLALVVIAVTAVVLWSRRRRVVLSAAVALAVLWGGLVLTFSQSSFASLLVGLAVLAALRWNARRAALATAAALVLGTVFVLSFQDALKIHLGSSSGLNRVTSGRVDLIEGGIHLFADRPLWGHGSGSFARTFRVRREGNQAQAVSASHTLPVTVAAEQGLIGLIAYLGLLAAAFAFLVATAAALGARAARGPPRRGERDDGVAGLPPALPAAGAGLLACFAALVAHTMTYAAFLEDPLTWAILGVALGLTTSSWARAATGERRPAIAKPMPASV